MYHCNLKPVIIGSKACIDSIFDEFAYLQLVIEDFHLLLPNHEVIENLFAYDDIDCRYLMFPEKEYYGTLLGVVEKKAKQVLVFIDIMKFDLKWDKQNFSSMFSKFDGTDFYTHLEKMTQKLRKKRLPQLFKYLDQNNYHQILKRVYSEADIISEKILTDFYTN